MTDPVQASFTEIGRMLRRGDQRAILEVLGIPTKNLQQSDVSRLMAAIHMNPLYADIRKRLDALKRDHGFLL